MLRNKFVILAFLLTGCSSTPHIVKMPFPEVPKELIESCPDNLEQIPKDTTKLSEVLTVVTDNYSTYHKCRIKNDAWIEWYKAQKNIWEAVK